VKNGLGKNDKYYFEVMNFTDLTVREATGEYLVHETFHDLRKRLRASWRTPFFYAEMMPLTMLPLTIKPTPAYQVCVQWRNAHVSTKGVVTPCSATANPVSAYEEFGVTSCYAPSCSLYVTGADPSFRMPTLFDRRAMLGEAWRPYIASFWDVDAQSHAGAWAVENTTVLELLFENSENSHEILRRNGWPNALIVLGTAMAMGGYYHVKPCLSTAEGQGFHECHLKGQQTPANIGSQKVWDWVERMGNINDAFFEYDYLGDLTDGDPTLITHCGAQTKADCLAAKKVAINANWLTLKNWMEGNVPHGPTDCKGWFTPECGNNFLWLMKSAKHYSNDDY